MRNWNWTPRGEFVKAVAGALAMGAWLYTMWLCLWVLLG